MVTVLERTRRGGGNEEGRKKVGIILVSHGPIKKVKAAATTALGFKIADLCWLQAADLPKFRTALGLV